MDFKAIPALKAHVTKKHRNLIGRLITNDDVFAYCSVPVGQPGYDLHIKVRTFPSLTFTASPHLQLLSVSLSIARIILNYC